MSKLIKVGVALKATVGGFVRGMRSAQRAVGAAHRETARMGAASRRSAKAGDALGRQTRATARWMDRGARSVRRLGAQFRMVERYGRRFRRTLADVGKAAGKLPGGKVLGGLGAALAVRAVYGKFSSERDALLRVGTVTPEAGRAQELARSRAMARAYALDRRGSVEDVLSAEYALRSGGIANAPENAQRVLKLARVTGGMPEQVAETFRTAMLNFSNTGEEIGDLFAKTQLQYSIRNFGQLGEALNQGLDTAVAKGFRLDETLAVLGELHGSGKSGGSAGTVIDALGRQFEKAGKTLGFEVQYDEGGQVRLLDTLKDLKEASDAIADPGEKARKLQEALGDEGMSILPVLERFDDLMRNHGTLVADKGVLERTNQLFEQDDLAQFERLSDSVSALGTALGKHLIPPIAWVAGGLADVIGWIGRFIDESPVFTKILGAIGIALGFLPFARIGKLAFSLVRNFGKVVKVGMAIKSVVVGALLGVVGSLGEIWDGLQKFLGLDDDEEEQEQRQKMRRTAESLRRGGHPVSHQDSRTVRTGDIIVYAAPGDNPHEVARKVREAVPGFAGVYDPRDSFSDTDLQLVSP